MVGTRAFYNFLFLFLCFDSRSCGVTYHRCNYKLLVVFHRHFHMEVGIDKVKQGVDFSRHLSYVQFYFTLFRFKFF